MMNQEVRIKVKIFCITFGLLVVFTNYHEYRKKIADQTATQQSIQNKAIEKSKAEAALKEQREKNNKNLIDTQPIKSEQEYADIIKNNLERNCTFWKNQYILSKRVEDKVERDKTCKLVNRYFQ